MRRWEFIAAAPIQYKRVDPVSTAVLARSIREKGLVNPPK